MDVDILKEGGTVWTSLLGSAYVPDLQHDSLATLRAAVKQAVEATGRNMKRDGGVSLLGTTERDAALNLFKQLAEYGVFAVPGGELEFWLKSLGATGHGPAWLINVFERMGEDPDGANYLKPGNNDVWRFLSEVKTWLVNPARKGIPA